MHGTDCACGRSAVRTRRPLSSVSRSNTVTALDRIDYTACTANRRDGRSPPSPNGWRRCRPTGASPTARGCSSPAAARRSTPRRPGARRCRRSSSCCEPERDADLLVVVSHEGETPLTLEAATRLARPDVARDRACGRADRRAVRRGGRLHAGDRGELVSHRELHLRGRRDRGAARRRHRVAARARSRRRSRRRCRGWGSRSGSSSRVQAGIWPTAHEAVLKLREGAWVAAEAYETEQLLHGYLAAVDESVRAFVLEGEGRRGGAGCGGRCGAPRARL